MQRPRQQCHQCIKNKVHQTQYCSNFFFSLYFFQFIIGLLFFLFCFFYSILFFYIHIVCVRFAQVIILLLSILFLFLITISILYKLYYISEYQALQTLLLILFSYNAAKMLKCSVVASILKLLLFESLQKEKEKEKGKKKKKVNIFEISVMLHSKNMNKTTHQDI